MSAVIHQMMEKHVRNWQV